MKFTRPDKNRGGFFIWVSFGRYVYDLSSVYLNEVPKKCLYKSEKQ